MQNTFLTLSEKGKNNWWRFGLTILSIITAFVIANIGMQEILPSYKSLFPENQFGKDLGTSILIGFVFGIGLIAFSVSTKYFHGRPLFSYISIDSKFNWTQYLSGFIIWSIIILATGLITDYNEILIFLNDLQIVHFLILFAVGFITIGIQSFFEELIIRGYILQGIHLKIKNIIALVLVNGLIFGLLHFGYGIGSFIHSFSFGIAFVIIVLIQDRIEFASGAHNANNLVLSLVFLDLADATNATFSWSIDWLELSLHLISVLVLIALVYKFFKK